MFDTRKSEFVLFTGNYKEYINQGLQVYMYSEDNCLQNCHLGRQTSLLWLEILFYGDALAKP